MKASCYLLAGRGRRLRLCLFSRSHYQCVVVRQQQDLAPKILQASLQQTVGGQSGLHSQILSCPPQRRRRSTRPPRPAKAPVALDKNDADFRRLRSNRVAQASQRALQAIRGHERVRYHEPRRPRRPLLQVGHPEIKAPHADVELVRERQTLALRPGPSKDRQPARRPGGARIMGPGNTMEVRKAHVVVETRHPGSERSRRSRSTTRRRGPTLVGHRDEPTVLNLIFLS